MFQARTVGWIGIGFSPNGGMKNADMVVTWVDQSNMVHLYVRNTRKRFPHELYLNYK